MLFEGPDHPVADTFDVRARLEFIDALDMTQSLTPIDSHGTTVTRYPDPGAGLPDGDGTELVNFASNDFLDLATDDRVQQAAKRAVDDVGVGATGSRPLTGDTLEHRRLERDLATARRSDRALLFPSTYAANLGVLAALYPNVVFSDARNHTSIVEGCRSSPADVETYAHCDVDDLDAKLAAREADGDTDGLVIVTESLYSMDGDVAPLDAICDLAEDYGAWVVVDGAHACGLYDDGGGIVQREGLSDRVDVQIGGLSKTLASQGGYVAGDDDVVAYLANTARPFLFSTALTPPAVAGARRALEIARESDRSTALRERAAYLRTELREMGWDVPGASNILPVMTGDHDASRALADYVHDAGFLVFPVPYPAVPRGTSRVRVNPMATHERDDLDALLDAFDRARRDLDCF
jgi:8-amino-7-oxononanoate synthase